MNFHCIQVGLILIGPLRASLVGKKTEIVAQQILLALCLHYSSSFCLCDDALAEVEILDLLLIKFNRMTRVVPNNLAESHPHHLHMYAHPKRTIEGYMTRDVCRELL